MNYRKIMKLIADNLRITRPEIQNALKQKDAGSIRRFAQQCRECGAWAIDVNTGPMNRSFEQEMNFFIDALEQAVTLPLLIDTSNPRAMRFRPDMLCHCLP